jgi:hypothetical protein
MKKNSLLRFLLSACTIALFFLNIPVLNAQKDILDLYSGSAGGCVSNSEVSINVNFDGCNTDTTVIIRNVSGYRLLNYTPPDNQYKFFGANNDLCGTATSPGETRILFKLGVSDIKVKKFSFLIFDNSDASITNVRYYINGTPNSASATPETTGTRYLCQDNTTGFDYVSITYSGDGSVLEESQLFVLDKVYLFSPCPSVAAPTIGTITQPTCTVATGSVILNGLPSGSWTITPINFPGSGSSTTISGLAPGTYKYRVKDSDCCTSPESGDVVINPQPSTPAAPTITASGPLTFCSGGSVTLTSSAGSTYLWSTGATTQSINVTTTGSYTVQITNAAGCLSPSSAPAAVTVNAVPSAPTITASGPLTFCSGGSVTLTSSAGSSYSWSTGATTQSINVTTTGSYTVQITNAAGCPSSPSSAAIVTVNSLPVVTIGTYGPYCIGASPVIITGNPTDANGHWSGPGITDNNNGTASFNPAVAGADTHTVTYTYTGGNGCPNTASTNIEVLGNCPEIISVIDLSGSMEYDYYGNSGASTNSRRIAYAKKALWAFVDLLNENFGNGIYFGLAGFKNLVIGTNPADCQAFDFYQTNNVLNDSNIGTIQNIVDNNLTTGHGTPLLAGLEKGKNMFQHSGNKAMVLLSDGAHNCPSYITDYYSGPYNDLMSQITDIKVHTIGFGQSGEVDLALLENIACRKDGIFCDLTDGSNVNLKLANVLNPSVTPADVWDAKTALQLAYSNILGKLGLTYSAEPAGVISRGTTQQFDVPVSIFDTKVCFFISWVTLQPEYLKVRIKTSDNTELPVSHPDVRYINRDDYTIITVSGSYLTRQGVVGQNPWKLEISASDISGESEKFQYVVLNKSKELNFNTWFDKKRYFTGDKIKICLELLAGNERLIPIDKTVVSGTMPAKGAGNLMASNKVTLKQLEELRKAEIENVTNGTNEEAVRNNLNDLQRKELLEKNISSLFENQTYNSLKAQMINKEYNGILNRIVKINGISFNDEGKFGDEKAGDGIYTAQTKRLNREGLYSFNITAIDTSKGKNIRRENQLNTFVKVKIKPWNFVRKVAPADIIIKGEKLFKVYLNLRDGSGNKPLPGFIGYVNLSLDKGTLVGSILSNPDGSFTQTVSIPENIRPSDVKITMKVYDQEGTQRMKSRIPWWIYIGGICVISVLTGAGVSIRRKRNRETGK